MKGHLSGMLGRVEHQGRGQTDEGVEAPRTAERGACFPLRQKSTGDLRASGEQSVCPPLSPGRPQASLLHPASILKQPSLIKHVAAPVSLNCYQRLHFSPPSGKGCTLLRVLCQRPSVSDPQVLLWSASGFLREQAGRLSGNGAKAQVRTPQASSLNLRVVEAEAVCLVGWVLLSPS